MPFWGQHQVRFHKGRRTRRTQAGPSYVSLARYPKRRAHNYLTASKITTRIPKAFGNPVAQRTFAWLNYAEVRQFLSGAAGVSSDTIFNMNSIFDPDRSGVGHQPYGHDTYATLYNRYRVHKFKYNIRANIYGNLAIMSVIPLNNVNTTATQLAEEQTNALKSYAINTQGDSAAHFAGTVDLAALNGVSRLEYNADDRFEALFSASPTELMGLHVMVENPAGTQATINAVIKFSYYVELFDPIPLAGS